MSNVVQIKCCNLHIAKPNMYELHRMPSCASHSIARNFDHISLDKTTYNSTCILIWAFFLNFTKSLAPKHHTNSLNWCNISRCWDSSWHSNPIAPEIYLNLTFQTLQFQTMQARPRAIATHYNASKSKIEPLVIEYLQIVWDSQEFPKWATSSWSSQEAHNFYYFFTIFSTFQPYHISELSYNPPHSRLELHYGLRRETRRWVEGRERGESRESRKVIEVIEEG